jgi:hypothetical protein
VLVPASNRYLTRCAAPEKAEATKEEAPAPAPAATETAA